MTEDTLVVIPAREGSKGIPFKNIKPLNGKPLIHYTIESAKEFFPTSNICVSTDGETTRRIAEQTGIKVPFLRPAELATDTAGSYEVLLHAIDHYEQKGNFFEKLLLLQPTSPFRQNQHFTDIFELYDHNIDMVVSVGVSHHNPYFSMFEEEKGFLRLSKQGNFKRRQDCPKTYFFNGSMYLININSLKQQCLNQFERVKKMVMDEEYCIDIDTPLDWLIIETLLKHRKR